MIGQVHSFPWPDHGPHHEDDEEHLHGIVHRLRATRQNTLRTTAGQRWRLMPPFTNGGPAVWRWNVINWGPGSIFVRWDGGRAAIVNDEHAIELRLGAAFEEIAAPHITIASVGIANVSFTAANLGD
jgi:hypothetical protein